MRSKETVVNRDEATGRNIGHDLTGVVFGKLTVLSDTGSRCPNGYRIWRAECVCGEIVERPSYRFVRTPGRRSVSTSCRKCAVVGRPRNPDNESHINYLWNHVHRGALTRGIRFNLSKDEVKCLFESDCSYCGAAPRLRVTSKNLAGMYAWNGIDRLDSDGDYVWGNVTSCCPACNAAKSDMSVAEFEAWVTRVYNHLRGKRKRLIEPPAQSALLFTDRSVDWYFPSKSAKSRRLADQQSSPASLELESD